MKQKILILYTAIGQGHKSMGENIGWHLEQAGYEVKLADIGKVQEGKFSRYTIAVHQFINRNLPFVWAWLYMWGYYLVYPFRTFIASFNYKLALAFINDFQPDLVITVQTTASAILSYLRKSGKYKNKWMIGFSDYHLHPFWIYKTADAFITNIPEQKEEMVKRFSIAAEKIFVCGMLLKPNLSVDMESVKQRLGISLTDKVVLVGTGSLGIGFKLDDLKQLARLGGVKLVFVCGKNVGLYEKLKAQNLPNTIVEGFYTPMQELYATADVFVSKPGGLTTAESLAYNLPMIVTFTLPGQEDINYQYLLARNLILGRPQDLAQAVTAEINNKKFRKQLQTNPLVKMIIGNPQSLLQAVTQVLLGA